MDRKPYIAAALAAFFLAAVPAGAQSPAPVRHLVYDFTWGNSTDLEVHSSGIDSGGTAGGSSGMTDFSGGNQDHGTISVDVLRQQTDTGLVVRIAEQGTATRKADPAECVVYSSTSFVCDPNAKVNDEEQTLLRFLGSHFVDPALLDANHHWHLEDSSGSNYSMKADYTISSNDKGMMTIDENRVVKLATSSNRETDITTKIDYDFSKTIPIALIEYTIERGSVGEGQYQTNKSETTLKLDSDSMAKP